jgi:beta-N-acetylhexosaminidase
MGQLFMMGFDGTEVNPQIRSLIENYHLGAVLLSAKNLKCIMLVHSPFGISY